MKPSAILTRVEDYLSQYVSFTNPDYAFVAALWAAHTHVWPHFDATPYLVVTSATKQSGKTLFGVDLMSFVDANAVNLGGMTPAVAFRTIDAEHPTLHVDEAETLNSEAASDLRAAMNMGYKKGARFRRIEGRTPREYDVFCPKVFVLIGDVYDTLHDRSIIIRMVRGKPAKRFVRSIAQPEGNSLRAELSETMKDHEALVTKLYTEHKGLDFLSSRDEEIWLPLFVVCEALAPQFLPRLLKVAVDMAAEKSTIARRSYIKLLGEGVEEKALDDQYSQRLVADLLEAMNGHKHVYTADALDRLKALPTAPWRAYRGEGLQDRELARMLSRHGVEPKLLREGKKVARGYKRADVEKALKELS